MLIRQLEYLVALASERHFGRAAIASHVSQPALSEGIRRLEAELGVPIVRRDRSFQGFTPEGERVVAWAQRIIADRDGLLDELAAGERHLAGRLRIATIPAATQAATDLLARLAAEHPHLRISLLSLSSIEIARRLENFTLVTLDRDPLPPATRALLALARRIGGGSAGLRRPNIPP